MRVSHAVSQLSVAFDDPNLVSCAGLVPALRLASRTGLAELVAGHVRVPGVAGANPHLKVPALVAGMIAGADSIDDMDLLRHGGTGRLFTGIRAPSTLGIFLRAFTFGHVRQLDAVASRLLARLAAEAPLIPEAEQISYLDFDDTVAPVYGSAKQGAGRGYTGIKGLNAFIATVSTPAGAPVITATRLRRGNVYSVRGGVKMVADAIAVARRCGATGSMIMRADSAFYAREVIAAARRAGVRFSVTARLYPSVVKAIDSISETAWTPIRYADAVFDQAEQRWISDAEIAETPFAAFTSHRHPVGSHIPGRLIVRRIKRLNKLHGTGQEELFPSYQHYAVFTDTDLPMMEAEACHRGHAIIEQVFADLKAGPLAHLPSGSFAANSAWLVLAAMAFNLTRAAGTLASAFHAKATTATIRRQLISIPARLARSARRLVLHLPVRWPWQSAWQQLFTRTCGPPHSIPC